VEDRGVGFEWQLSLFEPRAHGFGLWSVADRVRAAAGEMTVDTGPGRGCRVSVLFPVGLKPATRDDAGPGEVSETKERPIRNMVRGQES
jgi:signal transduction histidine kinase